MINTQAELAPTLDQHEVRITALETSVNELQRNHNDLKVTIMEENRDTRRDMHSLMTRVIDSFDADRARDDELRKVRMTTLKDILLGLFGAGGLIYGIIELFLK